MYLTRFFTIFTTVLSKPLRSAISRLHHQYTCSTCPSNTCAVRSLCALCPGTEADACFKTIRCPSGDESVIDTVNSIHGDKYLFLGTTRWEEPNRQTRSLHYITHTFNDRHAQMPLESSIKTDKYSLHCKNFQKQSKQQVSLDPKAKFPIVK